MLETNDTISVNDFKAWLQGVEDMQEDGWVPSPIQWKKIRSKIDQIGATQPATNAPPAPMFPSYPPNVRGIDTAYIAPEAPTSSLNIPIPTPSARVSTFMAPPPPPQHFDSPKTPDIDTSSGNYSAPFV